MQGWIDSELESTLDEMKQNGLKFFQTAVTWNYIWNEILEEPHFICILLIILKVYNYQINIEYCRYVVWKLKDLSREDTDV